MFDDFDAQQQSEEYYQDDHDLNSLTWEDEIEVGDVWLYDDEYEELPALSPLYQLGDDNNFYPV
jgi:hypothetical protein